MNFFVLPQGRLACVARAVMLPDCTREFPDSSLVETYNAPVGGEFMGVPGRQCTGVQLYLKYLFNRQFVQLPVLAGRVVYLHRQQPIPMTAFMTNR